MFTVYVHVFFFNYTATTEIYTLSLHDALPISAAAAAFAATVEQGQLAAEALEHHLGRVALLAFLVGPLAGLDRKSTRLNSSHANISYAVFCLKKKNNNHRNHTCTMTNLNSHTR